MIPRTWQWLLIAVASTALLAIATFSGNPQLSDGERVQYLSERFACPVCDGQAVSESNAAVASTIREFIAVEVNKGSTDTEIRDELVQSYGTSVLMTPPSDGAAVLVWILPIGVLVFGMVGIAEAARRGRIKAAHATKEDFELVAQSLASTEARSTEAQSTEADS